MKNKKLLLTAALLTLILFLMCGSAMAAESGTCGENLTWTLDDAGVLTICGSGAMDDYSSKNFPWCGSKANVQSIIVENGVTNIGSYAFYYCGSLTSITLPESVTSIGKYALSGCDSLADVTLPEGLTSIGDYGFYNCDSITDLTLPGSLTSIGRCAFGYIDGLTNVTICEGVTSIGKYAFYYCRNLASVRLSGSLTSIGNVAFEGCNNLKTVEYDGDRIERERLSIGSGNTMLKDADWHFRPYGTCGEDVYWSLDEAAMCLTVSGTGAMSDFSDELCPWDRSAITDIVIQSGVTRVGNFAFFQCGSLQNVTIEGSGISVGEYAFYDCDSLTSIGRLNRADRYAFCSCGSLQSVTIGGSETTIGHRAFSECGSLTDVTILDGVTSIGDCAFNSCGSLTVITLPASVTGIGYSTFSSCDSLKSVEYGGDRIERSQISVGSFNSPLTNATWHYRPYGTCGDSLSWSINEATKSMIISGSGDMTTYTSAMQPWDPSKFTVVTVQDGVTSLSDYAFKDTKLTAVCLPDSVTAFGTGILSGCTPAVYCYAHSSADDWANSLGLPVVYLDNQTFADYGMISIFGEDTVYIGKSICLQAAPFPEEPGLEILWSSSDETVASVTQNGCVNACGRGTAVITAEIGSTAESLTVTVQDFSDVGKLTLSDAPQNMPLSTTWQPVVEATPDDETLVYTWTSSDESVLHVDENGLVTAVGKGTASVTVSACGVSATSAPIRVYVPLTSLSMPDEFWGVAESVVQLTWTQVPSDADIAACWTVDDASSANATITEDGVLRCFMPGDVTVTLTDTLTGKSVSTLVHVCSPVQSVELPAKLTVFMDQGTYQLEAVAVTADDRYTNRLLTFTADNEAVATVSADGLLTFHGLGKVNVTATAENGVSAVCTVTVDAVPDSFDLELPAALQEISEEAFLNDTAVTSIALPENCTRIGSRAFAECTALKYVRIPCGDCVIAEDAFGTLTDLVIVARRGSNVAAWAEEHGFAVAYMD